MSKQLEYIIKQVLQEQFKTKPKLVTKTALLDGKATNFIKTEVCPKLGIDPNALETDSRINGFQVIIERKGDVSVDPDETAEILYTPEQLQEDVLDYLALNNIKTANSSLTTNDGMVSTATFPNTVIAIAPSTLPSTSINNFSIYINGQYVESSAIVSFIQAGSDVLLTINNTQLGFGLNTTFEIVASGKFSN